MKKEQPKIKRVKIDELIRDGKKSGDPGAKRKRGRPRKNLDLSERTSLSEPLPADTSCSEIIDDVAPSSHIEPLYDTTEEAKAIIQAPFSAMAGLSGIKELALDLSELEAIMPSWKIVYDKRIAPSMGEMADVYAFSFVMLNIGFKKVRLFKEAKKNDKNDDSISVPPTEAPTIRTEAMTC